MPHTLSPERSQLGAPLSLGKQALASAFADFTDAAASLEHSYSQLQGEVGRLRCELENTNRDLARSMEENHRMRQHLNRILEGLPCGVLVTEADGGISLTNPELRRLLGIADDQPLSHIDDIADSILDLLHATAPGEEKQSNCGSGEGVRWIAIRRAKLQATEGGSIFIFRDITEAKRQEQEREAWDRREALVEISALLAHEVRNPLGSLELFAGLLAGSELESEQRQWAGHLQAGLRTLGATVNNRIELTEGASVQQLVNGLQKIGATARDVIAILQAIKAAGALEADLEVI